MAKPSTATPTISNAGAKNCAITASNSINGIANVAKALAIGVIAGINIFITKSIPSPKKRRTGISL